MTGTTRVICVNAAFAAIDHLLNEMMSYVSVLSCGSTLFASLRGREQTSIDVSVSKAHFIPQTPSHFAYRMTRKSCAMIVEHALYCHDSTAHAPQSLQCTQNARTYFWSPIDFSSVEIGKTPSANFGIPKLK